MIIREFFVPLQTVFMWYFREGNIKRAINSSTFYFFFLQVMAAETSNIQ